MGKRANGEGSIYQRKDGKWVAALTLGAGKRKYFYCRNQADAVLALQQAQRARMLGTLTSTRNETVEIFLLNWLQYEIQPRVRERTYQTYTLDDSFVLHRPAMKQSNQPDKVQGTAVPAGGAPLVFKGSDGRLEVQVPRGSLDFAHATLSDGSAPVGQLLLQIHQISGHYIGTESILGTYQIQVVDSQGDVVQGVQVLHPLTIVYHYQVWEMQDLNMDPNQVHLAWPDLAHPVQQPPSGKATPAQPAGAAAVVPMTNDPKTYTLTAQTSQLASPMTLSSSPEIATPTTPDLFEASGNSGQYIYTYPLAVAPGPAGFAPQLQLNYSSQSTNERHNRRAPAGDEGEGWSLSLGSISAAQYPSSSTGGAATWYSISGIDGVSDKLVPGSQANYYETEHISHELIKWTGSCWNVWGRDGTWYQIGCTSDSVRKTSSGSYEWDVDMILAPYNNRGQVKAIFLSYLQDSPDGGITTRDAAIKQIQYGYATSAPPGSLSQVVGTVDFHYHMPNDIPSGQGAFATAYPTNYNCASSPPFSTTLRCDDPPTYNSIPAPIVMATMSLDSVTSYIGADTANQPAFKYTFTYQDQPFVTNYWNNGGYQSAANEHLLTKITPIVYRQGTPVTRKGVAFGYVNTLRVSYNDPSQSFSGQTW